MSNKNSGEALGMIETLGFVGLVEAADAVAKAANVKIVNYEQSTGALVIIKFRGSVGAVKAAAEAGAQAAQKVGELAGVHIIPAPDPQIEFMIAGKKTIAPRGKTTPPPSPAKVLPPVEVLPSGKVPPSPKVSSVKKGAALPPYEIMLNPEKPRDQVVINKLKKGGLANLPSPDLRKLASNLKNFPLSKWLAGKAPKKKIIELIIPRGIKFPDSDKVYYADKSLLSRKRPVARKKGKPRKK